MTKKGHYLKMRPSSDLLFARNEYSRGLWRAVGGQRWAALTSIHVVVWGPSAQAFELQGGVAIDFRPTSVHIWRHWYEAPNERMSVYLAHKLVKNGGHLGEYWGTSPKTRKFKVWIVQHNVYFTL